MDSKVLSGVAGVGKGGALFGPAVVAGWVDQTLAPGTSDQRNALSFRKTLRDVYTLAYFVWSPNLVWFAMAATSFLLAPYDIDGAGPGGDVCAWLSRRFALNYTVAFSYYGFWHYGLYVARWGSRKFAPGSFPTAGNMAHNLWYWSLGIVQFTFWEYAMCRIWASGQFVAYATTAEILADPKLIAWNVLWILAIPIWRDLHFYIAHRFIHIRAVYKFVHSLHHRNADPEPFSGMTMHPIEHLYYFSNAFTPSLYLSGLSPLIFLWNFTHLTIAPGAGHSGWEDNWQADQYHFVHHAKFECNYGSPFSAFIDQFFGTFREKLGESVAYKGEFKHDVDDEEPTSSRKEADPQAASKQAKAAASKTAAAAAKTMATTAKKRQKSKAKEWSAKGYLGMPATTTELIYTAFWVVLLGPVLYWGAVLNHDDVNRTLVRPTVLGMKTELVVALALSYSPVAVAIILCWLSGDRMSWRWPFQKEQIVGPFGLFLGLGWAFCVTPVFHATMWVCSAGV